MQNLYFPYKRQLSVILREQQKARKYPEKNFYISLLDP